MTLPNPHSEYWSIPVEVNEECVASVFLDTLIQCSVENVTNRRYYMSEL